MDNKPEHKIRIGAVCATLWKSQTRDRQGREFVNTKVVLDRSYKDAQGNWASTGRLDVNDIPKARVVLARAYDYILEKNDAA